MAVEFVKATIEISGFIITILPEYRYTVALLDDNRVVLDGGGFTTYKQARNAAVLALEAKLNGVEVELGNIKD